MKTLFEFVAWLFRRKPKVKIDKQFLTVNSYSRPGAIREETLGVVIHWPQSAGATAQAVRDYFESLNKQKRTYGSTQFVVGLAGEIIQMMPEDEVAWQVGETQPDPKSGRVYTDLVREKMPEYSVNPVNPNYCCVGMEVCHPDWSGKFTEAGFDSAAKLAAYLLRKYNLNVGNLYRHWDIVGFKECPLWYVQNSNDWDRFKDLTQKYFYEI